MSIATVVTRGFKVGSAVGVASVATRGYGNTSTGAEIIGRPVFRRKTRIWTEEELAGLDSIPEVQIAETRADEYSALQDHSEYLSSLLADNAALRASISDKKNEARLVADRAALVKQIRDLKAEIQRADVKMRRDMQLAEQAVKKAKERFEEEQEVGMILLYLLNHRD